MDSRQKIVSGADAASRIAAWSGVDVQVVSGLFDPLLLEHSERLNALKRAGSKLVVLLQDQGTPVLPLRARAELVAALRCVDLVVTGAESGLSPSARFDSEDADATANFVAYVLDRMN